MYFFFFYVLQNTDSVSADSQNLALNRIRAKNNLIVTYIQINTWNNNRKNKFFKRDVKFAPRDVSSSCRFRLYLLTAASLDSSALM